MVVYLEEYPAHHPSFELWEDTEVLTAIVHFVPVLLLAILLSLHTEMTNMSTWGRHIGRVSQ